MKKTLTVNLGGTVYNIDEDAYGLLDEYLSNLRLHFAKEEGGEEIVNDIETRISELFQEKITNTSYQVVTIAVVEEIIKRMGKPEELTDDEEEKQSESTKQYQYDSSTKRQSETRKGLYRNPDDKILGGVFGGLAAYLGWDATLLRLVMLFALLFAVGSLIPIYIVCWIFIPLARTATEKLNMRGEAVTMENIGKTVTDSFEKASNGVNEFIKSDKPRTFFQKLADVLVSIAGFLIKILLVIIAIVCSPLLIVLGVVFVALIIAGIAVIIGGGAVLYEAFPTVEWGFLSAGPMATIVASIAGVILVGIPLVSLVFTILRGTFNWQPMGSGLKWTLFIMWVVSSIIFICTLAEQNWQVPFW
ncbi:PspC domain-containing protein [Bacteroides sp. 214]|uniref:PspC domain-containing protein n=1 Tax=Bacteroides sp. 214 TaxID=2302935 RepID=UPI0013D2DDB6|nr:PspC domain-containing protein [Bacteroides sp. 214]NDW12783.1 PspC domain-containing protein [Bacteroides sp. 214]